MTHTDPNGNRTSFTFDRAGRLTAKTSAWGSATSYQYNNRNLVSQITNGRGQTASLQYDAAGRLTSLSDPAGTVSYTYDANGNVLTVSDSTGTISRKYDALNRVTEYTDTKGNTIRYDYDTVGNLTALTYPGWKQVRYDYDAANRLSRVTDWAGRVTFYEYDANNRLTRTSRPNGTVETRSYDAAGQLTHQSDLDAAGNVIIQYDYAYDAAGNVTAEESAAPKLPFTLDNAAMTFTSGNRLTTFNGQPVSYDADGNMTIGLLGGKITNYVYDARNRLMGAGSLSYQYDAENNRISVTDSVYNTLTRYVINPNTALSQVLIQSDAQGNQTYYVYGLGLVGQEQNGNYLTYHFDLRGSTVALTDVGGNITDRFQYAPYGEMVKRTGTTSTPFLYNGRYDIMSDGNGLYYMRTRYYNPEIRRFINQDILLGGITNSQSLNRYAYVNGQPVSYTDPFGLAPTDAACEGANVHREFSVLAQTLLKPLGNSVYTDRWISKILQEINFLEYDDSIVIKKRPDLVVCNESKSLKEVYELKPISYLYNKYKSGLAEEQINYYASSLEAEKGTTYLDLFNGEPIVTVSDTETQNAHVHTVTTYQLNTFSDKPGMIYYEKTNEEVTVQEKSWVEEFLELPDRFVLPISNGIRVPIRVP